MSLSELETVEAMREAGIPKFYARPDASLSHYITENPSPTREALRTWFTEGKFKDEIPLGQCLYFAPDSEVNRNLFYLTARALLLKSVSVRVMPLILIVKLSQMPEAFERLRHILAEIEVFGIVGFYDQHYRSAYSEEVLNHVEWILRRRIENQQSLLICSNHPNILQCQWYSQTFLNLLANAVGDMRI